jgi:hypothetical protein
MRLPPAFSTTLMEATLSVLVVISTRLSPTSLAVRRMARSAVVASPSHRRSDHIGRPVFATSDTGTVVG